MMARITRKVFSADVIGLLLVLIALQALTYGLSTSLRTTETSQSAYFFWVCLISVLLALGLSKQKVNGFLATAAIILIGGIGVWILGARLAGPLLDLGNQILSLILQLIPAIRSDVPVDTTGIANAWRLIVEASNALTVRVQLWLSNLNGNVRMTDALVRNMIWTLMLWFIAAWMGWFAGRRNAIAALLPSIVLLAVVISYSRYSIETLWLMVFVLLLLMGLWNYKNHTTQWDTKRVDYADSIQYDIGQYVLFLTVVIGAIALITPSISWRAIRDALREWNQPSTNEAADVLGIQQKPAVRQSAPTQQPSLPRDHLLSGGFAQSENVVMVIRTGELAPVSDIHIPVNPPRYYWRSTIYDTYVGAGWVTSPAAPQTYPPNTPLIPGLLNGYRALHLDVEMTQPEKKLFWSGILFSANIPFAADWRVRPQSNLFADQSALLQADMFAAIPVNDVPSYKAESYVPLVVVRELRAASSDYPEAIRKQYLQLPASLPGRVRQLAESLTQEQTNAYDKAKAIEAYLRTYPYDLEVPAPPEGQDVADFFLFDLKKGYCDYYATAMVVLARASGIPARFVSGYAPGSYDAINAQYVIRELNAHSWAEVYFPDIGWVEFEPTASEPEINRIFSDTDLTADTPPDSFATDLLFRFRIEKASSLLLPVALILFGLVAYYAWIERWRYLQLEPDAAIEKIYRRLYRLGRPLAGARAKAETAYEFMQKLVNTIDAIRQHPYFARLFSNTQQEIELLTELYQATLFGQHHIQKQHTRNAVNTWKRLRLRLLIAQIHVIASRWRTVRIL